MTDSTSPLGCVGGVVFGNGYSMRRVDDLLSTGAEFVGDNAQSRLRTVVCSSVRSTFTFPSLHLLFLSSQWGGLGT